MKSVFLFIIAGITIFTISACQQESPNDVNEESVSTYSEYLEINEDLNHIDISNLTIEEEKIYIEARERFGKIVDYKDLQFYLLHRNYSALNISERLFGHFEKIMNHSNDEMRGLSEDQIGRIIVYSDVNITIRVKTRDEGTPSGGYSGFERTFWGFNIYLSNNDLLYIAAGGDAVGLVASMIPDPTLSTKVVAVACGLAGLLATMTAISCPNGIVIYFAMPVPLVGCMPYSISKQL